VGLASEVLALHPGIRDTMLVENRAGELQVTDQAARNGSLPFDAVSEHERETIVLTPSMILGAASRLGDLEKIGRLRLVGLLYEQRSSVCVPISESSYLMVTTPNESLQDVMKALQDGLPNLIRKQNFGPESLIIISAIEADQAVQSFFTKTKLCEPNNVHLEDAILNTSEHSWQISGTYRPAHAVRSRHYNIELDARTGAVTKFQVQH